MEHRFAIVLGKSVKSCHGGAMFEPKPQRKIIQIVVTTKNKYIALDDQGIVWELDDSPEMLAAAGEPGWQLKPLPDLPTNWPTT